MDVYTEISSGSFFTPIDNLQTQVSFSINSSYQVVCVFFYNKKKYNFRIQRWMKDVTENTQTGTAINQLILLMIDTFNNDEFGTLETREDEHQNITQICYKNGTNSIQDTIIYVLKDVFKCIEEIVITYQQSTLAYVIYHIEDVTFIHDNYKQLVHLIACNLLLTSRFIVKSAKFPLVEFAQIDYDFKDLENSQ